MPFKSDKIKIAGTRFDRRIKLTEEQKKEICNLHRTYSLSQRKLAEKFNVSKSLIAIILDPKKKEQYKIRFKDSKKNSKYLISKERRSATMREYRRYKQRLYISNEITD